MAWKDPEKRRAYYKKYYREHLEQERTTRKNSMRRWRKRIKEEVLAFYSKGSVPACIICGEDCVDCLSIDHINNDGYKVRKGDLGYPGGARLYQSLKNQGYPAGYQTLCMNCQYKKRATFELWFEGGR